MHVEWSAKDVAQCGQLVKIPANSELFITAWRQNGAFQEFGLCSMADGMFIAAGSDKGALAAHLTKYCYVPAHPTPSALHVLTNGKHGGAW